METTNYKPRKSGFSYKLLKYLLENGESAGIDAQKEIGINAWADAKGPVYYSRASQTFDSTAHLLQVKGLVKFLPDDYYKLTKIGKEFIENYINTR